MNSLVKQMALSFVYLNLLTGCLYGQCINGPCSLEHSRILKSIKPYGVHWVNEMVTEERRRTDSWACGAANTAHAADHVIFSKEQQKLEMKSDESNDSLANTRLTKAWISCMESKGYRYQEQ
jgi:hypothetical protein